MNQKYLLLSIFALSCAASYAATPYFSIRSQSVNAAGEIAGWQNQINLFDKEEVYASVTLTPGYTQSFRPGNIASTLFGPHINCNGSCPSITISGSRTTGAAGDAYVGTINTKRGTNDWLADNFGLPTDFASTLKFTPKISNFNADINVFIGLDEVTSGLYFRVHAPITYSKWNLNLCEKVTNAGTNTYKLGYFSDAATERKYLLKTAQEFFSYKKAPTIEVDSIGAVTFEPLKFSKFPTCAMTQVRLSDIEAAFGWNFVLEEDYHLGLAIRGSAPTGNKPEAGWLFEPMVGSGGHWKLGGTVSGHCCLWRSDDEESSIGFWVDANIQHLFNACQKRSFDLCGKPNSRYMLAQKLGTKRLDPYLNAATDSAGVEFQNAFAPVANLTTFDVKTSVAVEGDVVAKFAYTNESFQWDLGYEFWGRSCEKICANCIPSALDGKTWALKGDAAVVGFEQSAYNHPVRLAATQSKATITAGTNGTSEINGGIDNPVLGVDSNTQNVLNLPAENQTNTSNKPVFLDKDSIGYNDARTKGTSHKVFTHVSYTWLDNEDWTPFLGIGASAEFAPNDCCNKSCSTSSSTSCNTSCAPSCSTDSCNNCGLSQWAVWAKGGLSFN